jgi:hypothetical protein
VCSVSAPNRTVQDNKSIVNSLDAGMCNGTICFTNLSKKKYLLHTRGNMAHGRPAHWY